MANNNKTLYEVLGVARNAKVTDVGLAYKRMKAELQKETSAPNPRLAAMAKVAYETLSDPDRRAEYDATLESGGLPKGKAKGPGRTAIVATVVVLVAVAGAGYYFFARPSAQSQGEKALSPQEIIHAVAPHLARVQGALMSGEVRDLGIAVATGEHEMATTCRGIAAGMLLTVRMGEFTPKAELARASEELDICLLTVKDAAAGIKVRPGVPGSQEKIQAVFVNANGKPEARQVSVARPIKDAKWAAFELKAGAPLPNGTPVFDSQARLVGIVVTPHSFGEGMVVALGAARIEQARTAPAETTGAGAAPSPPAASTSAPPASAPPASTAPASAPPA